MKQNFICAVVDDDLHAIEIAEDYISQIPMLTLTKSYTDPLQALVGLAAGPPIDLLFLDIDMPALNGLQLAEKLSTVARNVIFTTGHNSYASQAFEVRAKHYLLKPIAFTDFSSAVAMVVAAEPRVTQPPELDDSVFVRTGVRNERIRMRKRDIYMIESAGNYVTLMTQKTNKLAYMTMKEMAEVLAPDQRFFQIRKSAIINCDYVERVDGFTIIFKDISQRVSMSKVYREPFLEYLNSLTLISKRS